MAIVRQLEFHSLQFDSKHTETHGTFSIVKDKEGHKYLQIDTYGSTERKIEGKKSQTIRFSVEAVQQLREILAKHFAELQ